MQLNSFFFNFYHELFFDVFPNYISLRMSYRKSSNEFFCHFHNEPFFDVFQIAFSFECHTTNHAIKFFFFNFFHELFFDVFPNYISLRMSYRKSSNEFFCHFHYEPFFDVFQNYFYFRMSDHKSCKKNFFFHFLMYCFLMFSQITFSFECYITNHAMEILLTI